MSAEMMMKSESGSLGGIVHVAPTYYAVGNMMRRNYALRLFDPEIQSIGESFTLDNLVPQVGFYWYMKQITNLWADPSLKLKYDTTVGVEEVADAHPQIFTLYQNYPNPFNPSTTIKFALPVAGNVKINVYNTLGQLVEILVDGEMQSGYHQINFDGSELASGVYIYQLQASNFNSVKKMLLLK
jgi:hypothetical protein